MIDECILWNEYMVLLEERVSGMEDGLKAMFTDPVAVVEAMGQNMTDTYAEEGLAYAVGYVSLDVIMEIAATKGAGGAKGAAKAAETAADAASPAKKVDTVTDAVKTADKATDAARAADKVSDAAGAAKKVDTVTDAAETADKATDAARAADKVSDAAGAAKKVDMVTDAASAEKTADTAMDAAGAVYTVDKVEETADAAKTADTAADAAKTADGLEVKGGTAEVEAIPEVNPVVGGGADALDEIKRIDEIEVEFNYNSKYDETEFARQLADQQKGMNELMVQEYLDNRQQYLEQGRAIEGNAAQQAAREKAFVDKVDELQDAGLSLKEAEQQAQKWLDTQAALHNPDQIAGGNASNIGGVGDKSINSSIGSQWRYRIDAVDEQIKKMVEGMSETERKSTYLNVNLTYKGE